MRGLFIAPPPLPAEVLARVLRLATVDGRVLLIVAGIFAVLSALGGDRLGAVVGCLAAGAGAVELHGVGRLRLGDAGGMTWLVRSQLALLAVVFLYVMARLMSFDPVLMQTLLTPERTESFRLAGLTDEEIMPLVETVYRMTYGAVALASLVYQGGMAWYYHSRRETVRTALETPG